jgi:hypothetical protein
MGISKNMEELGVFMKELVKDRNYKGKFVLKKIENL